MAIFQSDLSIKTAIELGMQDLRENIWLVDDILSDAVQNPYLREKYGQKQIDACKEWFLNNQIDVYMRGRNDRDKLPCITISLGASHEKTDMKHMADQSTEKTILLPNKIGKPIAYVVKPFAVGAYDASSGVVEADITMTGMDEVSEGMILVNPSNGKGYIIHGLTPDGIQLEPSLDIDEGTKLGIVPQYQYYEARIEHTFFQESYTVGCHAHGDEQSALWLHSIVLYSLLRYREGLLEANGFAESVISSGDLQLDPHFASEGGERAFVRYISLTGQVENSWIKTPRRFIESVGIKEKTGSGFLGGIKILSNLETPDIIDPSEESWYAIKDDAE